MTTKYMHYHIPYYYFIFLQNFQNNTFIINFLKKQNLPSCSARYCTEDVLPVPVSPTSKTGSWFLTHTATLSNKTLD